MIKIISVLSVCALVLVLVFSPHVFSFTTDSLIYISTAQNLTEGRGLVFDNVFVEPPGPDRLPLKLYPPGYSFLIAFFHILGANAYTAALLIPRFFFLLLPAAFFLVFKQIMPQKHSMVTAGLCAFMFPYLKCALMAWTDIPFLFLSLMSFFFLFKTVSTEDKEQLFCVFLSGIFTSSALLMRNVGYALFLSIGLGFILMFALRIVSFKKFAGIAAFYITGFLTLSLPYMVRNLVVFGMLNPYRLPPANVTLRQNLMDYGQTLSGIILVNSQYSIILLILVAGLLIWFMTASGKLLRKDKQKVFCAAVLIIYFLLGSLLVIIAKTIYFGPEKINERYLIQYAWIIMAGLSYCAYFLLLKLKARKSIDMNGIVFLILIAFLTVQIFPAVDFYFRQKRVLNIAEKIERHAPLLSKIPEDYVIVSNVVDMTGFFSRRDVRLLNGYTPFGLIQLLGAKRRFAVFIVKERNEDFRSYLYPFEWLKPQGYRSAYSDADVTLWLPE